MKHTLTKGVGSSYVISVELNTQDRDTLHQKTLKSLQGEVSVQGFRPGHVPLHMVEKQIKPEYLRMAFLEEALNASINDIIKTQEDKKFIGQPYDLHDEEKDGVLTITYKLDTYPDTEVLNDDWKKLSIAKIDTAVTKEEEEQAYTNLIKQYAEYTDTDTIEKTTLVKAKYSMLDKDGAEIHKGSAFFGEQEFNESSTLRDALNGKKKDETIELAYDEKKLPHAVHYHPHNEEGKKKSVKTLQLTIADCKTTVLPDFNDSAVLEKTFQTPDIKTNEDLRKKINSVLAEQKEEQGLQQAVEEMLAQASKSLKADIPETFIKEEMKARIKQLGDRMGGEEWLKQYFAKIGEQKTSELYDDIKKSAQESLGKFFVMRKLVELLGIEDIDWNNNLDAERKIYAKLVSDKAPAKKASAHKEETTKDTSSEKPKKTTKKKAA
jgi:trigger factor